MSNKTSKINVLRPAPNAVPINNVKARSLTHPNAGYKIKASFTKVRHEEEASIVAFQEARQEESQQIMDILLELVCFAFRAPDLDCTWTRGCIHFIFRVPY